jgi:carbonic anhydrase
MPTLDHLFDNNRRWADAIRAREPEFFRELSRQQSPEFLWIGCSDSRVPANQIVGLRPGELFVHRNVANVVVHADLNCLAVMQFAVDLLRVRHIIVCGHYGCSGVRAALLDEKVGLADNWLRHVQDVKERHADHLARLEGDAALRRLCELNVLEQAVNVCQTTVVREAWARGQELRVHAWIYGIEDGLLRNLGLSVGPGEDITGAHERAIASLG